MGAVQFLRVQLDKNKCHAGISSERKIRGKAVIQRAGVRGGGGGIGWSTLRFAACCSSSL